MSLDPVTEIFMQEKRRGERLAADRVLAAIVENSDDAIISKTLQGTIQSWNAAAQRVFGYTAEQAIGCHISLIIPAERLAEEDQIMRRLRAGERVDHFETVRVRSDGRRVPISLTISPIRDTDGRVVGASKIARDISARKQAEAMLREREQRLLLATRTGKVGIWEWDPATDRVSWTDSLYAIHGVTRADFDGTYAGFARLVHAQDRKRVRAELERTLGEEGEHELEYRALKPDGSTIWLYTTARAVEGEGEPRRMIGATLDITERKQAEDALKKADRRKDEFLATLAHELRNPLAPIWTASQVLKLKGSADRDLQWSSEVIDRQMRHMVRLLEDLLDVSRVSLNKLELRKERVDLADVIGVAVETSRPMIDGAQHQLALQLAPGPVILDGDPVRLAQIFSNLLNNASKYMAHGGRIVVRSERHAGRVAVTVQDHGIGIRADALPHLFEIFAQGDVPAHRGQGGLGIGLSLARALAELHGGTIEARSEGEGLGSEFVVTLPVVMDDMSAAAAETGAGTGASEGKRRRMLIVDDLRDSADSLAELMRVKGHDVHTAYDGATAVAAAARLRPDVMLLDIGLPKLSGYEVCRKVRALPGGSAIFIIALTGWGQATDRLRTEEAGFDWHLVKPVDGAALADLLGSIPIRSESARWRSA